MSFSRASNRGVSPTIGGVRQSQIHSHRCHCNKTSYPANLEDYTGDYIHPRARQTINSISAEEKALLESRVRFMELQNQKLHLKLIRYQQTMEEMQKTHLDLINMVKREHQSQRTDRHNDSLKLPGFVSQTRDSLTNLEFEEGQYLVSLKRLRPNHTLSPEAQSHRTSNEQTNKKVGIRTNIIRQQRVNVQSFHLTPQRPNPQNIQSGHKMSPVDSKKDRQALQRAQLQIKRLEVELERSIKFQTMSNVLENQNQLLRMKLKNGEEVARSADDSEKYHQIQISKLKRLVEQHRQRDSLTQIVSRENTSLKQSIAHLRKEYEELEAELQAQKGVVQSLRTHISSRTQQNQELCKQLQMARREASHVDVLAEQLDRQKRSIVFLNEEMRSKSSELLNEKRKVQKLSYLGEDILDIKRIIQEVDLKAVETEEKKIIAEEKSRSSYLTHQVKVLNAQIERLKQEVLLLEDKLASTSADKSLVTSALHQAHKENAILNTQINSLETRIEAHLRVQSSSQARLAASQPYHQIVRNTNKGLSEVKYNLGKAAGRLGRLQQKLVEVFDG